MNNTEFFKVAKEAHTSTMMGCNKDETTPMLYMKKGDRKIATPLITNGKMSPMDLLKTVVYKESPDAYLFCAEVWIAKAKKEEVKEMMENYQYGDIAKMKEKEEALVMYGATADNKITVHESYHINRDEGGRITSLIKAKDQSRGKWKTEKAP